jgi:hypothetical protein
MGLTIISPIGSLTLDAALSTSFQADVEVTEHPVERGAAISDHARPKPEQVQVSGLVTDTPVGEGARALLGNQEVASRTRAGDGLALLRQIRDEGHLCTITDSRISLPDMLMTALNVPRNPKTGRAVEFSATFRRIVTVEIQTVRVATVQRVNDKKDLVKLAPKTTDDATSKKSLLKRAADSGPGNTFMHAMGLR